MSENLERCCLCDELTGRAGRGEDSLYINTGKAELGPLCPNCWQGIADEVNARLPTELTEQRQATLGALAMVEEYGGVAARKTNELEQAQASCILMSNAILAVTQSVQECSSSLAPHVLALVQKACVPSPGQDLLARLTKAEAACAAVLNGGWLDDEDGTTTDGSTPVRDQVTEAAQPQARRGEENSDEQ